MINKSYTSVNSCSGDWFCGILCWGRTLWKTVCQSQQGEQCLGPGWSRHRSMAASMQVTKDASPVGPLRYERATNTRQMKRTTVWSIKKFSETSTSARRKPAKICKTNYVSNTSLNPEITLTLSWSGAYCLLVESSQESSWTSLSQCFICQVVPEAREWNTAICTFVCVLCDWSHTAGLSSCDGDRRDTTSHKPWNAYRLDFSQSGFASLSSGKAAVTGGDSRKCAGCFPDMFDGFSGTQAAGWKMVFMQSVHNTPMRNICSRSSNHIE